VVRAFILFFYSTYYNNREYHKMVNFKRCKFTSTAASTLSLQKKRTMVQVIASLT